MKKILAAISGLALFGFAGAAHSAVLQDEYWGGIPSTGPDTDVIGGGRYSVTSLSADRTGDDLVVTVNSNYLNNIGTGGTQMGSLFIGDAAKLNLAGSAPAHVTDQFINDTDRFSYVFDYDIANSQVSSGAVNKNGSLYALNGTGDDVRLSFGTIFRAGQAIDRANGGGTDTGIDGSWSIGAGSVTFTISDFFTLSNLPTTALTLAWSMSCANDVIIGSIPGLPGQGPDDVPLPAGIVLLLSGLTGIGVLGHKRARKA
jgi:hypothetical protein